MRYEQRMSYGFGSGLTPLGKKLVIIYGSIYVAELIFEHWLNIPIVSFLMLRPFDDGNFHFWQILTHPFIHDPAAPLSFLIDCLILYFFIGPVEAVLGSKRFLMLFYFSALGGALCGLIMGGVSGFYAPFSGMMPSLLSIIVIFGLLNPDGTILLMFVLPLKAKYLSYGTVLITVLTFLAKANPYGAYHLGGMLFGYICFKGPGNVFDPDALYLRYLQWQFRRRKSRFSVIDGGKDKDDKDKPTYH